MAHLIWKNLADDKCPQCDSPLGEFSESNMKLCTNDRCSFVISKAKFYDITDNLNRDERKSQLEGFGF